MPSTLRHNSSGEIATVATTVGYSVGVGANDWTVIPDPLTNIPANQQSFNGSAWVQMVKEPSALCAPGRGVHGPLTSAGTGSFFELAVNASARTAAAAAANRLDLVPFVPMVNLTVDQMIIECTTLLAASNARIGVYGSLANGAPGALLDQSGDLSCAAAGLKTWTPTSKIRFLAGNLYWIGVLTSGTQALRMVPQGALLPLSDSLTGAAPASLRRATQSYASGMPSSGPAGTLTAAAAPWVQFRLG